MSRSSVSPGPRASLSGAPDLYAEIARPIFHFYDRDGDGKLTDDEFLAGLLAGGVQLTKTDFYRRILGEFGSNPGFVTFKNTLAKLRTQDETTESLLEKLSPFAGSDGRINTETLRFIMTVNPEDRLSEEETNELVNLVDPGKVGTVNVKQLCETLIPSSVVEAQD